VEGREEGGASCSVGGMEDDAGHVEDDGFIGVDLVLLSLWLLNSLLSLSPFPSPSSSSSSADESAVVAAVPLSREDRGLKSMEEALPKKDG